MSESILTVSECLLPVSDTAGHATFCSFDPHLSLTLLAMPVFALLTLLTLCAHCNLMQVLIGMQTLVLPPI